MFPNTQYSRLPVPNAIGYNAGAQSATPTPSADTRTYNTIASRTQRATDQRHAVKEIALDVENIMHRYKGSTNAALTPAAIMELRGQLIGNKTRLLALRTQGLSDTPPPSSLARTMRSGAVMFAGSASRAAAVFSASAGAVVQAGVGVVAAPVAGAMFGVAGAVSGKIAGEELANGSVARIPAAVIGASVGAVTGAVIGAAGPLTAIAPAIAQRGSLMRKAFRGVDHMPAAQSHVARKSMSTHEIAERTDQQINAAIASIDTKHLTLEHGRWAAEAERMREASHY